MIHVYWLHLSGEDVIPRKRVDKDSLIGAIVGGAVGGLLVVLLVIGVVLIMHRKQKKKKKGPPKPLPSVLYSAVVRGVVNQSINQSIVTTRYLYVKRGKIPSKISCRVVFIHGSDIHRVKASSLSFLIFFFLYTPLKRRWFDGSGIFLLIIYRRGKTGGKPKKGCLGTCSEAVYWLYY